MGKKSLLSPFIIIGVGFLMLLGGGIAAIYLLFPPEKIVAIILPQVEKTIGRRITFEKASFSFLPRLGLTLSGLTVGNTGREGFSLAPFLTMENFTACISVASLFKGYPEITQIVLKKPTIRIEVSEQGAFNFDDFAPKDSAAKALLPPGIPVLPIPLTLEKLVITSGTLIYDDRKMGLMVTVGTIKQEARIAIDRNLANIVLDGTLRLSDISVKIRDVETPLKGLEITVAHDIGADLPSGIITVNRIDASCGKIACVVTGTMKDVLTKAPMFDLTLSAQRINVQNILSLLPAKVMPFAAKLSVAGTLATAVQLRGRLLPGTLPVLTGSAKVTDVTIHYDDAALSRSIDTLNAAVELTDKSVTVDPLTMRFGRGTGAAPGRMANSLAGTLTIHMADGKFENTPFQKTVTETIRAFLHSDQLEGINPINFSELSASIRIANRRAFIDEMKILSDFGDWKARGSIGFDAGVDMAVSMRLSKQVSGKVLDVEGAAKEAAKRLLAGTQLSAAAGFFDNLSLIPHDKEGRISLKFALSGTVSAPQVGSLTFGDIGQGNGTGGQAGSGSDEKWKNGSQEEMIKKAGEQIKNALRGLL
jgi:uncharacterized protein involved in outer membrane biogenesis